MSPDCSQDLTEIILREGNEYLALRSPDSAGHDPDYRELGRFKSEVEAEASFQT
jgi:hypothetical protein